MKEYRIQLTPIAERDITAIGDYIAYGVSSPDISNNLIKSISKSLKSLKIFPYKYPLVRNNHLRDEGIRCMPVKNYYVFYKISDEKQIIIILRVVYKRRDWKDILT